METYGNLFKRSTDIVDGNISIDESMLTNDESIMEILTNRPSTYIDIYETYIELCKLMDEETSALNRYRKYTSRYRYELYKNLLTNKKYMVILLTNHPDLYDKTLDYVRDDITISQLILDKLPQMFIYSSKNMKNNKHLVLKFVGKLPMYLQYVSDTYLPSLNLNLQRLYCSHNKLTSLPILNINLQKLNCSRNQLTSLPPINNHLQILYCSYNQLTSLPPLNKNL